MEDWVDEEDYGTHAIIRLIARLVLTLWTRINPEKRKRAQGAHTSAFTRAKRLALWVGWT